MRLKLYRGHWCELVPKSIKVSRENMVTILWNRQVQCGRTIPNTKPSIIIRGNRKKEEEKLEMK